MFVIVFRRNVLSKLYGGGRPGRRKQCASDFCSQLHPFHYRRRHNIADLLLHGVHPQYYKEAGHCAECGRFHNFSW
ncbi:hypothetical protein DPMN_125912 [Dreissena polymorpha]|uniref:Uncharacterized protein n=1 Tax=Dreissena polymorpha TaxID=45954 RepID=A0A9D4GZ62_DREPO|nr:hypothetical protein DPMN_125912 [Dreissena polymorpha]